MGKTAKGEARTRRERHSPKRETKAADDTDPHEDSTLLAPPSAIASGLANAQPAAAPSSPLLVRPEDANTAPSERLSRRKKHKKAQQLLSKESLRAAKSRLQQEHAGNSTTQQADSAARSAPSRWAMSAAPKCFSVSLLSSCLCLCFGSLRPLTSPAQLPQLSAEAQDTIQSLDPVTKKSRLEVFVRHTDNMPFSSTNPSTRSAGRPHIILHLVDVCTGMPMQPPQVTKPAIFSAHLLNAFEWNASQFLEGVALPQILSPHVIILLEIVEPRKKKTNRREKNQNASASPDGRTHKSLAWCFFKPVSDRGRLRLPSLSALNTQDKVLRLQLFAWQPLGWFDAHQARRLFNWNPAGKIPNVFLQYQKRTRVRLPCSLHVEMRPIAAVGTIPSGPREGAEQTNASTLVGDRAPATGDNQEPPAQDDSPTEATPPSSNQETETSDVDSAKKPSLPTQDALIHCQRHAGEPCLIPHRVLHRLPTGRHGCSCLSFSPDGLFLAAAAHQPSSVSTGTDEWVIRIHQVHTGLLWQSCRSHQSMIYSLEWALLVDGRKAIVSASSDGSAALWLLRETMPVNASVMVPHEVWQHVPAPVFVYCAIVHAQQPQLVLTGASDGYVRVWGITSSGRRSSAPTSRHRVSSAAVHSIRMEPKSGRLLCGDAGGCITVWDAHFVLLKTVRTGQRTIASLQLHPRKQHLLVLTHPHALLHYELRSFLLLHKNYTGVACDQLLVKACFSPDGQFVVSGSEDGVPHVFTSVQGQRAAPESDVWGRRFFHGHPLLEVAWSPTSHVVALGGYGGGHPVVVLCAHRGDAGVGSGRQHAVLDGRPAVDAGGSAGNHHRIPEVARKEQLSSSMLPDGEVLSQQRRQQRLQATIAQEHEMAAARRVAS